MSKKQIAAMEIRPTEPRHYGSVHCKAAVFSPDSRLVASSQITEMQGIRPSYGFARLRVWERATGQEIRTLSPAVTTVLAFSPNGRFLAAGRPGTSGHLRVGYGAGIDVWDVLTGKKVGGLSNSPRCLSFSPDGKHMATGGWDHCATIWKAPKTPSVKNAKGPSTAKRKAWWSGLGGPAKDAYKVMAQMLETPEHALATLKQRVKPVQPADPSRVAQLITKLDSEKFADRIKAQTELEKLGESATHLIKKHLERKLSLELSLRLRSFLQKYDTSNKTSALSMQQHRAVAMLEWIGTPTARALLQTWAKGAPGARLVLEAKAALKRLQD